MSSNCARCEGKTKDGKRCQRQASCRINCTNYCWQHAKSYKHVARKRKSSPRGACHLTSKRKSSSRRKSSAEKRQVAKKKVSSNASAFVQDEQKVLEYFKSQGATSSKNALSWPDLWDRFGDNRMFTDLYGKERRGKAIDPTKNLFHDVLRRLQNKGLIEQSFMRQPTLYWLS